jgi:hypothetical protein
MKNPAADWEQLLRQRITDLLAALAAGDDAPPALRFKAEGIAETGLALGFVDEPALALLLDTIYREHCGASIAALFPFTALDCIDVPTGRVMLPFVMRRAPVHRGKPTA